MKYTMEEVIQFTINILTKISVPVTEAKEIGVPVQNALNNLKALQEMIAEESMQTEAQKRTEENDGREADSE